MCLNDSELIYEYLLTRSDIVLRWSLEYTSQRLIEENTWRQNVDAEKRRRNSYPLSTGNRFELRLNLVLLSNELR
jgi:hypothetical protein